MVKVSIFDFDQTTSIDHTYLACNQKTPLIASDDDIRRNTKKEIQSYFQHNADHLSAIATFHNKPEFIQRYIELLLDKSLIFNQTILQPCSNFALNIYDIAESPPYIRAYIPYTGKRFDEAVKSFKQAGKNGFIKSICERYEYYCCSDLSTIEYYDDSIANVNAALELNKEWGNLSVYIVSTTQNFIGTKVVEPLALSDLSDSLSAVNLSRSSSPLFAADQSPPKKEQQVSLCHSSHALLLSFPPPLSKSAYALFGVDRSDSEDEENEVDSLKSSASSLNE